MLAIAPRPSGRVADDFAADASDGFEDICSLSAVSLLFLFGRFKAHAAFWQCAQVPVISTTESFGAKPEAPAAAFRLSAIGAAGASPTVPQRSQIRNATRAALSWS